MRKRVSYKRRTELQVEDQRFFAKGDWEKGGKKDRALKGVASQMGRKTQRFFRKGESTSY